MKAINFEGCKTAQEIEERVKAAVEHETIFDNDIEAEAWFKESGFEGEVIHRDVLRNTIWLHDEYIGEYSVDVKVKEHYAYPEKVDYVYSYSVRETNKYSCIRFLKKTLGNITELMEQNAELATSLFYTDEQNYDEQEVIELLGYEYDDEMYEEVSNILYAYGCSNIVKEHPDEADQDYTDDEKQEIIAGIDSCIKELTEYLSNRG